MMVSFQGQEGDFIITIVIQVLGVFLFFLVAVIAGKWLRADPCEKITAQTGRITGLLYYLGLFFPFVLGFFWPGLDRFDGILNINPLPFPPVALLTGLSFLILGYYLVYASIKSLRKRGKGAPAFNLTKQLVERDIYSYTRNPMSLGYYLACAGFSLVANSTYLTLYTFLLAFPAHVFYLKYYEEKELETRFGNAYLQYKQTVPFLIPRFNGQK
ncbi:MAG: methyltransferase family protein [Candidatus Odinarchaeota archaeon]